MATLAVSSFSLHSMLGPLIVDVRNEQGVLERTEYDFPREYSLQEFVSLVPLKTGARAVELCQIQFQTTDGDYLERLESALAEAGVSVLTLPIDHGNLSHFNSEWRREDVVRSVEWFRIAKRLGAQFVRVNAGSPGSQYTSEARPGLVESLTELGEAAGELGMSLLVENHGGTSSDPDFLLQLREDVGADRLGFLLDIGNFEPLTSVAHARFRGGDVDTAELDFEPLYAAVAKIAPHASLVHAKAIDPAADGSTLPDVGRALSIVAGSGYQGSVSVEWEGRLGDPWQQTASLVDQVRRSFPHLS